MYTPRAHTPPRRHPAAPHPCRLEGDIAAVEKRIHDLESSYFEEAAGYNVVKGWAGFVK